MSEVTRHVRTHSLRCALNDIRANLHKARGSATFVDGTAGGVVRMIDGTKTRNLKSATADTGWANCVVLWGGTQLDHKVSTLYQGTCLS